MAVGQALTVKSFLNSDVIPEVKGLAIEAFIPSWKSWRTLVYHPGAGRPDTPWVTTQSVNYMRYFRTDDLEDWAVLYCPECAADGCEVCSTR